MDLLWNGAVYSLELCLAGLPSPRIAETLCCVPFARLLLLGAWRLQRRECHFRKLQSAWEATLWVKACWRCCASFWGMWSDYFASSWPAALYQSWLQRAHLCTAKSNPWIIVDYSFIWVSCRSCQVVEQREYLTEVEGTPQGLSSFLSFCVPHASKRGGDNSWSS